MTCEHWSKTEGFAKATLYAACPWCHINQLSAALEKIKQVRYGLDTDATDQQLAEYWSNLALEYRRIAAEALRGAEPQSAPHAAVPDKI